MNDTYSAFALGVSTGISLALLLMSLFLQAHIEMHEDRILKLEKKK